MSERPPVSAQRPRASSQPLRGSSQRPLRAYLDHAATTPMLDQAREVVAAHLAEVGNPSSLHTSGRRARRVVEEAREAIAAALGARPSDLVFTAGGTEADNLAVKGLYWARRSADPARRRVLASAVEHHAVLDPLEWLARSQGAQVERIPVDGQGRLVPDRLREAIESDPSTVALVSVMWANNEVGTLQPIGEVVAAASRHGIPVHSDAVQALSALPLDFGASGVTAMSLSAHKAGGPPGVGALLLARGAEVVPVLHGGGQERMVRSGTLAAAGIAGFAVATQVAAISRPQAATRLAELRDELVRRVVAAVPDATCTVPDAPRLPGIAHMSFPGCESDALLMLLDAQGIECSIGSACSAGVPEASHVLRAMGVPEPAARSSLRFSLGHTSTVADVDALVEVIGPAVDRARAAGLVRAGGVG